LLRQFSRRRRLIGKRLLERSGCEAIPSNAADDLGDSDLGHLESVRKELGLVRLDFSIAVFILGAHVRRQ
jgi:hypothetical protein